MFRYAGVGESAAITAQATLNLSRVSCIVMLLAYFGYLVFQLWTHRQLFDAQAVSVQSCFIVKFKKRVIFFISIMIFLKFLSPSDSYILIRNRVI